MVVFFMSPVSHFDKQEKQAQPYSQFLGKYSFHINQISSRASKGIEVPKYHKICLGKITFWPWVFKTSKASFKKIAKLKILRVQYLAQRGLRLRISALEVFSIIFPFIYI